MLDELGRVRAHAARASGVLDEHTEHAGGRHVRAGVSHHDCDADGLGSTAAVTASGAASTSSVRMKSGAVRYVPTGMATTSSATSRTPLANG
jgi:hypothetical protein